MELAFEVVRRDEDGGDSEEEVFGELLGLLLGVDAFGELFEAFVDAVHDLFGEVADVFGRRFEHEAEGHLSELFAVGAHEPSEEVGAAVGDDVHEVADEDGAAVFVAHDFLDHVEAAVHAEDVDESEEELRVGEVGAVGGEDGLGLGAVDREDVRVAPLVDLFVRVDGVHVAQVAVAARLAEHRVVHVEGQLCVTRDYREAQGSRLRATKSAAGPESAPAAAERTGRLPSSRTAPRLRSLRRAASLSG